MPRPPKSRTVCGLPGSRRFGPHDPPAGARDRVEMTVDEYETLRLIDLDGLTQQECAGRMGIARTTVQGIYDRARRKVADALVHGKELQIGGGAYRLCDGRGRFCGARGCHRHRPGRSGRGGAGREDGGL